MVDEEGSHLGVVPSAEDGRLGSGVVLVHELGVLLLLKLRSLVGAVRSAMVSECTFSYSHDTLGDKPVSHLRLAPRGVGSVLGIPVVGPHLVEKLVAGSRLGVNDTVLDEPLVNGRGRPGLVDWVGGLTVGGLDIVKEGGTTGWGGSGDDSVLLEPSSELVVVPSGEDVVLGVVELLSDLCGGVSSLGRNGAGSRSGRTVGGRDGRSGVTVGRGGGSGGLVSWVAVDGGGSGRSPVCQSNRRRTS